MSFGVLLLRISGPMQSWGTQSRFDHRDTGLEPSKSGVIGLVAAAMGIPRDDGDHLAEIAKLIFGVRVDREGILLRDFHTAGGGKWCGKSYGVIQAEGKGKKTVVSQRDYLSDAEFLVGFGGDFDLLSKIDTHLQRPVWPLFLGRKSFVPSLPVRLNDGLREHDELESALKTYPLRSSIAKNKPDSLRLMIEDPNGSEVRFDQPVSFDILNRDYLSRRIRCVFIPPPSQLKELVCT